MLLEGAKTVSAGPLTASSEEILGEVCADPCARERLVRRKLPVKSAGLSRDATSSFVWIENRPCRSQIGHGSSISRESDLVGMADVDLVVVWFATEEEHDAIIHVDAGVIVDPLGRIDDAIADEDDRTLEVCRGGIKDWEVVLAQLRRDKRVGCAGTNDRVWRDEWGGDHRGHGAYW